MYNYSNQDNNKISEKSAEWYGRYSKTVMLSAGIKNSDEDTYYYTKGMLEGKKNFTNSGVSINGGIGGEYGRATSEADNPSENIVKLRVKGGLSFKSKDFSAGISGDVTGSRIKTYYTDDTNITKTTTASFVSTVSTKHIELSATVSAINIDSDNKDRGADDKPSVTASVSVGLKNIFGKNIMPIFKYDVGNYNGTAQNVGAGVKITM